MKAKDAFLKAVAVANHYTDTHGGQGGTSNYNALENKPKINNVELFQASGVILGLIITSTIIFLLSKTKLQLKKSEIVEVL